MSLQHNLAAADPNEEGAQPIYLMMYLMMSARDDMSMCGRAASYAQGTWMDSVY